jgi:hypothetical protein
MAVHINVEYNVRIATICIPHTPRKRTPAVVQPLYKHKNKSSVLTGGIYQDDHVSRRRVHTPHEMSFRGSRDASSMKVS